MTRKSLPERVVDLIEQPNQEYLWKNFYTYSSNPTKNQKIIGDLERESGKIKVSYNVDLNKISVKNWWKKRVKKSGLSEADYLKKYYNGVKIIETKNISKRHDALSLFMKGTKEIIEFFKFFPELRKTAQKGQKLQLYELLAIKLILYFGDHQMWYNSFIVPIPGSNQSVIEQCETKILQNITNNFYTPANVLTQYYTDPQTNRKKNYIDSNGNILNRQAAIDRFNKLSAWQNYNSMFMDKLLSDGVTIYLNARKTNVNVKYATSGLSIELQELYECKKSVEFFTAKFDEFLTKQQIDKDGFLILRKFLDDPFYLYKVISEEKKEGNLSAVLLYQFTVFMSMVQSTYLIPECNFSPEGLKKMNLINKEFFALKYVINNGGFTHARSYIEKHKQVSSLQTLMKLSHSTHAVSNVIGDLQKNQNFSEKNWKDKIQFLTNTEFIWHLIKGYSYDRGYGGYFDLNTLSFFSNCGELISNWLLMRGTIADLTDHQNRTFCINNLIDLLLSGSIDLKKNEYKIKKATDTLVTLFFISIVDVIVSELELFEYIERPKVVLKQNKNIISMKSANNFLSIPAWAIPLYKTEVDEMTSTQETESTIFRFDEKKQVLTFGVTSIKHFIVYKSCRYIQNAPTWVDNFDEIGCVINSFLVSALQSLALKYSQIKDEPSSDITPPLTSLPRLYVEVNLQGFRLFASPKKKDSSEAKHWLFKENLTYEDLSIEDLWEHSIRPYVFPLAFNIEKGIIEYNKITDCNLKEEELFIINSERISEQMREYFNPEKRQSMWERKRHMKNITIVENKVPKIRPSEDENKDPDASHIFIMDGITVDLFIKKERNHQIIKNKTYYNTPHINQLTNLFLQSNMFAAINLMSYNGINHFWNSNRFGQYCPLTNQSRLMQTLQGLDEGLETIVELSDFSSKLRDPGGSEWYFSRPDRSQFNINDLLNFYTQLVKLNDIKITEQTNQLKNSQSPPPALRKKKKKAQPIDD